jgi:hypothetical protein
LNSAEARFTPHECSTGLFRFHEGTSDGEVKPSPIKYRRLHYQAGRWLRLFGHCSFHIGRRVPSEVRPFMIEATPTARRHVYFIGNQNSVRFIAPVPEHLGVGGLYEVSLYPTDDGGSRNRLEMSWRLFRETETSSKPQREERQVNKVAQIQFAYFGRRSPQDPAQWYNDWLDVQSLPDLIRMQSP